MSLATFLDNILHSSKRRRINESPSIPSQEDSDEGTEQQDPAVATLANQLSGLTTAEMVVAPLAATTIAADGAPRVAAPDNDASMTATTDPELPMVAEEDTVTPMASTGPVTADVTATETQEDAILVAAVAESEAVQTTSTASAASQCNAVPRDVAAAMTAGVLVIATAASVVEEQPTK